MRLKALVPPRVRAAVLRTMFNGWTTKRRFQTYAHCVFGCRDWTDEDSLEHYARCPFMHDIRRRKLNLHISPWSKAYFLTLHLPPGTDSDTNLTKAALLVYAIYRTFNFLSRHQSSNTDHRTMWDITSQHLYEGTIGHKKATLTLDNCFSRPGHRTPHHTRNDDNNLDNLLDTHQADIDACDLP